MPGFVLDVQLIEPSSPPRPELVSRLQSKANKTPSPTQTLDKAAEARKSLLDSTSDKARKANAKAAAVAEQVLQQRKEERARQEELYDTKIALARSSREVLQKQLAAKFDKRRFLEQSAREARERQQDKKSLAFQSHAAALLKAANRKQALLQAERERANSVSKKASDVTLATKAAAAQQQERLSDECAARTEAAVAKRDALLTKRAESAAATTRHARQVAFEQQLLQASRSSAQSQRCAQTLQEASSKRESFVARVANKAAAVGAHAQEVCEAQKAAQQQNEKKSREQMYQRLLVAQSNRHAQQQQQQLSSPGKGGSTSRRSSAPSSPCTEQPPTIAITPSSSEQQQQALETAELKRWVLHIPMGRAGAQAPACMRVPHRSAAMQALARLRMMQAAQTRRHIAQGKRAAATLRECRHVAASNRRHQARQALVLACMERHMNAQTRRVAAQALRGRFAFLWNARSARVTLQRGRASSAKAMSLEAQAVRCTMASTRRTVLLSQRVHALWRRRASAECKVASMQQSKQHQHRIQLAAVRAAAERRTEIMQKRALRGRCSFARAARSSQLARLARSQQKRQLRTTLGERQAAAEQRRLSLMKARQSAASASLHLACQFVVVAREQ